MDLLLKESLVVISANEHDKSDIIQGIFTPNFFTKSVDP